MYPILKGKYGNIMATSSEKVSLNMQKLPKVRLTLRMRKV